MGPTSIREGKGGEGGEGGEGKGGGEGKVFQPDFLATCTCHRRKTRYLSIAFIVK